MIWITILIAASIRITGSIKCFSCASSEYRTIFERGDVLSRTARMPQFDQLCDIPELVQGKAPVESCHSTCITIFEPYYFGGLRSPQRPFRFIRGCADKILAAMESRPREMDVLHHEAICVPLPLSEIYPKVQTNEVVEVCSCTKNGCNFLTSIMNGSTALPLISLVAIFMFYINSLFWLNSC